MEAYNYSKEKYCINHPDMAQSHEFILNTYNDLKYGAMRIITNLCTGMEFKMNHGLFVQQL